ncbi:hypothetical protein ACO2Q3_26250 [Caulobacter sp. KR2-114]|uniref:hypothetical protein n=1 Tax=Caulobacter sp. KR2-114 TaxID=3400912 RepID=UPI003C0E68E1
MAAGGPAATAPTQVGEVVFHVVAITLYNIPIMAVMGWVIWLIFRSDSFSELLEEKGPGRGAGKRSYARVTGFVGTVILTSFFASVGNVVLFQAMFDPGKIAAIVSGVGPLFLVGSALFAPYAFNQLRSIFTPAGVAGSGGAAPGGGAGKALNPLVRPPIRAPG